MTIKIRQLQLKELEILYEVDRICTKHNIMYFLSWGTALGAVRHGGFIPWDDDIDISMFWSDYVKFEKVCKSELSKSFFYQSRKTDKNHIQPWNKIRINNTTSMPRELSYISSHWGICIDIFPIFNIPDSKQAKLIQKLSLSFYLKSLKIKSLRVFQQKSNNFVKNTIIKFINKLPNSLFITIEKITIKVVAGFKGTGFCGEIFSEDDYDRMIFETSIFGKGLKMKFEEKFYIVPERYDDYLTKLYGEYMKLPKIEERAGHGDIIIDLDKDYTQYLSFNE